MTPEQFARQYGRPAISVITLNPGAPVLIPEDWHRYLLVFWNVPNNVIIRPQGDGSVVAPGFNMSSGTAPLILSHALHGSLVNLSYSVETAGPATTICVLEGQMTGVPDESTLPASERTNANNRSDGEDRHNDRRRRRDLRG